MQTISSAPGVSTDRTQRIAWASLYKETELLKAALRVYTKPLFAWRKALSASTDGNNLYDFARHGLQNLDSIHQSLVQQEFRFRPGLALHYNFNGKMRTLYIYPWEERIVDLLLYRLLSRRLQSWFSPRSFAYRLRGFGVDRCQRQIAHALSSIRAPLYVVKRDIANYFPSVDHLALKEQLARWIAPDDFLWQLLTQRIHFQYREGNATLTASRGIPFGTSIACLLANVYLTDFDRSLAEVPGAHYFRYADDFLIMSPEREAVVTATRELEQSLAALKLSSKPSHEQNLLFSKQKTEDESFPWVSKFRHLGLEFRASGPTGLSRDKFRKLCNLFRFDFRRNRMKFRRLKDPQKKVLLAIEIAQRTIERGIRNVAIIDYYLKHVEDEEQLRRLDRWLAEEVLARAFGGHRKGHFRRAGFDQLRAMGLPSLVHRWRLLWHGRVASPFFIWKCYQESKSSKGMAARPRVARPDPVAFSPHPEAAVTKAL